MPDNAREGTMIKPVRVLAVICGLSLLLTVTGQTPEPVDTKVIDRIIAAEKTSQVMDIAGVLTNTYGARLTNSASVKAAGEYARKKLLEWQLANVRLETFNFGNGWTNDRFSMKLVSDPAVTFLAYAKPWTVGTSGPVTGEVVEGVRSQADLTSMKGKLRGKFVLVLPAPPAPPTSTPPPIQRFTAEQLATLAGGAGGAAPQQPAPNPAPAAGQLVPPVPAPAAQPQRGERGERGEGTEPPAQEAGFFSWVEGALSAAPAQPTNARPATPAANTGMPTRAAVTRFYFDEGVAGMIEPGPARFGAIFAITDTGETVPWKKDPTLSKTPPQIVLGVDDYIKLEERVKKSSPVSLQVDIKNTYQNVDQTAFNVIGEIKGSDKATELVVLGAHLDTVHLGKGATDNAAGVAVVMEAVRLLKSLALPVRRTVQIGLWTGEEQGVLGSMAFVDKYFFQRPIRQLRTGHAKLSVYFNVDNGTGLIRGVNMQGNTQIKPIFEAWMAPFKGMGMTTLADRSVGSTDHISFDNIGLPGFQFIQDPIEYDTITHHSTRDTFDRLQKDDLMKNAAIVASWVYLAANRDEMLPRKPLPAGVYPAGSPVP
jgi:carboxypeptidase Q